MEKEKHLHIDDGLSFKCEICQDRGCQNCQGEYKDEHDPIFWKTEEESNDLDESRGDTQEIKDDGLSFDCEYCGDAPGGCPQCGFGKNRK